jgi:putative toxin-antitoxin system antitoxin component (TIGR02293 family)
MATTIAKPEPKPRSRKAPKRTKKAVSMPVQVQERLPAVHDYVTLLGMSPATTTELFRHVDAGLPFAAVEALQARTGLSLADVGRLLFIPARTLARRKDSKRLSSTESDRLISAARLFARVIEFFGEDATVALKWLRSPQRAFDGVVPLDMARTDFGAREIDALLFKLDHGIVV